MFTWKDKILDYEIETNRGQLERLPTLILEKIRFSITRLKPEDIEKRELEVRVLEKIRFSITRLKLSWDRRWNGSGSTWKDKILDYEIETIKNDLHLYQGSTPWKDKILDYEIETEKLPIEISCPRIHLKR